MNYNIIKFPEKGEAIINYENDQENIKVILHANSSTLWNNIINPNTKCGNIMVYYKNKFDNNASDNQLGRWILQGTGGKSSKHNIFNTLGDMSFYDRGTITTEENYDYIIVRLKNKKLYRTVIIDFKKDFKSGIIIEDEFNGEKEFDFFVNRSYSHIKFDENSKTTSDKSIIQRGYNRHVQVQSSKTMVTKIGFMPDTF